MYSHFLSFSLLLHFVCVVVQLVLDFPHPKTFLDDEVYPSVMEWCTWERPGEVTLCIGIAADWSWLSIKASTKQKCPPSLQSQHCSSEERQHHLGLNWSVFSLLFSGKKGGNSTDSWSFPEIAVWWGWGGCYLDMQDMAGECRLIQRSLSVWAQQQLWIFSSCKTTLRLSFF